MKRGHLVVFILGLATSIAGARKTVPYESFLRIANAKNVEGKRGSAKFLPTENNLNFMREFAGRLKS
jgi:hypothetical protein